MQHALIEFWQIRPILESVAQQGVDIGDILKRRGLPPTLGDTPPQLRLDLLDYFRIQNDIALALDDLTARLSSRKLTFRTGHFVVAQLQRAGHLAAAMESLVDHFNMMHGDAYNSVRVQSGRLALVIDDRSFPYSLRDDAVFRQFTGDCLLIKVHSLLDSLSGGIAETALRRVRLQRERILPGTSQNQFWSVPVDHGWPTYELVYDHETACQPLTVTDEIDLSPDGLFTRIIRHLETHLPVAPQRSITEQTRDLIEQDHLLQAEVAARLGMSVATHRRRLEEEGATFRDLVMSVRMARAESLLRRGRSIGQIADELDYSDIRAFNRAFKRWSGQTPAAYARSRPGSARRATAHAGGRLTPPTG